MASRKPRARSIKIDDKIVPGRIKSQSRGAISPKDRLLTCNSWIHSVHILVRPWWCCTDFDSPSHNLQRTEWLDGLLPSEFADWLLKAHDRSWLPLVRADWKYSVPHYYCCCWCQFRNMPQLFLKLIIPTNQILLLGIPYACLLRCFRIGVHYVWVLLEWYYHCIFRIRDQGAAAEKNKLRINPSLIILTDGRWTTPEFGLSSLKTPRKSTQYNCYPAKSHDGRMRSTQQNHSSRDLIRCGHPNGNRINPCSVSNLMLRHGSSTG